MQRLSFPTIQVNLDSSSQSLAECRRELEIDVDDENEELRQEPMLNDDNSQVPSVTTNLLLPCDFSEHERLSRREMGKACRVIGETQVMKQPVLRVARVSSLPITGNANLKEGATSDTKTRLRRAYLVVLPRITPADRMIGEFFFSFGLYVSSFSWEMPSKDILYIILSSVS